VEWRAAGTMNALSPPIRNARGRLLPGARLNPGGRPISGVTEIRARFSRRLPEIFDRLMEMAMDNSQPPMVQLAAIRLALDHLVGRPAVTITATHTSVSVADLYKNAMAKISRENSPHIASEQAVEGKADEAAGGNTGAASD